MLQLNDFICCQGCAFFFNWHLFLTTSSCFFCNTEKEELENNPFLSWPIIANLAPTSFVSRFWYTEHTQTQTSPWQHCLSLWKTAHYLPFCILIYVQAQKVTYHFDVQIYLTVKSIEYLSDPKQKKTWQRNLKDRLHISVPSSCYKLFSLPMLPPTVTSCVGMYQDLQKNICWIRSEGHKWRTTLIWSVHCVAS